MKTKSQLEKHEIETLLLNIIDNCSSLALSYEIIKRGFNLEYFYKNGNCNQRAAVVEAGFKYFNLKDSSALVRSKIARKGYYLDILSKDLSPLVRGNAYRKPLQAIEDNNDVVIYEFCKYNNCIDIFYKSKNPSVRALVAMKTDNVALLVDDPDPRVLVEVARRHFNLRNLSKHNSALVRREVALIPNIDFDWLVDDQDINVKLNLIKSGNFIKELCKDKDVRVRRCLASYGYNLDSLLYDNDEQVRALVAKNKNYAELLTKDKSEHVKAMVESHRTSVDKVINLNDSKMINNILAEYLNSTYNSHNLEKLSKSVHESVVITLFNILADDLEILRFNEKHRLAYFNLKNPIIYANM